MCGRPVSGTEFSETAETPPVPALQPDLQQSSAETAGLPGILPRMSAAARAGQLPVGFGNPVAMRVAMLTSLGTLFMEMIPGVNLLFLLWGLAAGWCAVVLYRRMTGYVLSVKAGARLGSITGILTFLSLLVITTLTMAIMGKDVFRQIKQDPQVAQALNDPPTLIAAFLLALLILFAVVVGTCAAGGALGARFVGRNSANTRV
jgi:hypothetical protein